MAEPDAKGLEAARRVAGWEIGDPTWANRIIRAYLDPEGTHKSLDAEDVPKKTGAYRPW